MAHRRRCAMPWLETDTMKERSLFVLDFDSGLFSMSELCERHGISRPTGYKWWERYRTEGLQALQDRSRRAQSCPHRTDAQVEKALVALRRAHPGWGPVTLLQRLKMRIEHLQALQQRHRSPTRMCTAQGNQGLLHLGIGSMRAALRTPRPVLQRLQSLGPVTRPPLVARGPADALAGERYDEREEFGCAGF